MAENLYIVSNRVPFSFSKGYLEAAETALRKSEPPPPSSFGQGGLVKAMSGLLKGDDWNTTWVGASMGDRDIEVTRGHYHELFRRMGDKGYTPDAFPLIEIDSEDRMHFRFQDYDFYMRFVFFDTYHMHSYYSKFANGFLWPLLHLTQPEPFYKKTRVFPRPTFEKSDVIQYTSSGVSFANTVVDEILKKSNSSDVVIWNQDYHLMQIGEVYRPLLKEAGIHRAEEGRLHIGHFMHTPFFNIHEIQTLIREDKRKQLRFQINDFDRETMETVLQKLTWGMLANDFIGFHAKEYCDNYLEALQEWFPVKIRVNGQHYEIRRPYDVTTVGAIPIGLDVDAILAQVTEEKRLSHSYGGIDLYEWIERDRKADLRIVGGLERCDYTKGLPQRLEIFKEMQKRSSDREKKFRLYQVTAPSRSENPDYQNLNKLLAEQVRAVNRALGGEFVIHLDQGISAPQNYRFMRQMDVMMVTPLEDGMNLVAFEYILSQKYRSPEKRGLLLLSTSGASRVLRERGFKEVDGVVYVNALKAKTAAQNVLAALSKGVGISDQLIRYVEQEHRVEDWARQNIDAILHSRKLP
ncbi:MAG TPA: trehalose-6-phosphate synthase [Desulfobacteria bacterium]|nr:trehalose-6-phosphate synthase [Desulfobacteria bacterium]